MLGTRIFSFSCNVAYPIKSLPHKRLLTLSQTTSFRLFQTERVGRQQFQIG